MHKKKLIEVAIPLDAINIACKADKDRKTGTVRNLHKWFAPMPLVAWRGLLLATILDDPGDDAERARLLELIEDYVRSGAEPPATQVTDVVKERLSNADGRGLPTVLDPFCGGGSTILEAQRLGLSAIGSDLNPVPILITSFLSATSSIGRRSSSDNLVGGPMTTGELQDTLTSYAEIVRERAWKRLQKLYPNAANGERVIAWRWARTVPSPDPRLEGVPTPLVGDWKMSRNPGSESCVVPVVDGRFIRYSISTNLQDAPEPTKSRCLLSGAPIDFKYIREQASHGRLGLDMFAVVSESRTAFAPDPVQVAAADSAVPEWLPDYPLPEAGLGFRVQNYGLRTWDQIFTPRQIVALDTFAQEVAALYREMLAKREDEEFARWVVSFLGLCVGKLATFNSSQCLWRLRKGPSKVEAAFGQAILPMTFDFAETNPFGGSVGDWRQCVETALRSLDSAMGLTGCAKVRQLDARRSFDEVSDTPVLLATDPPYFAQIGYADLSDFFYIWHRRALSEVFPSLYSTFLTPKAQELIADAARHGGDGSRAASYFVDGLTEVLGNARKMMGDEYPALVVYASRQEEAGASGGGTTAWEAMLEAVIGSGWTIAGTWPIWGTGATRRRAQASNALATYIVLVCRSRAADAPTESRKGFVTVLKSELKEAIRSFQAASIAPVDLAQAAMGPGMSVFSSYSRVLEADGSTMTVGAALSAINDILDEVLIGSEIDFDGDTRWAVTWFDEVGFSSGPFGKAEQLSKSRNTSLEGLVAAGIVESGQGRVRLLGRSELQSDWDPAMDMRPTVWEAAQHLIRALEEGGEVAASALLSRMGPDFADTARELAYRLFKICEARGWAAEAGSYNALVVSWPELIRLAGIGGGRAGSGRQGELL